MNGQQAGDPAKLAQALLTIAGEQQPPRRFIAGADAIAQAEQKLAERQRQIDAFRELSSSLALCTVPLRLQNDNGGRVRVASRRSRRASRCDLAPPRPQPVALLAERGPARARESARRRVSTVASGFACRFSHQAGSAAPQPFIAIVTRFGPSVEVADRSPHRG